MSNILLKEHTLGGKSTKMNVINMIQEFLPLVMLLPLTLVIHFVNIKPFQRGFFCDDHTLKYPYIENETVPQHICLVIWILISGVTILTTQILNQSTSIKDVKRMITGVLCCILLTDVAKYSVGRLRPHFLTLCDPDYNNVCFGEEAYYSDGDEELLNEFYQKYVNESEVCNNEKPHLLHEARLSFMSGHASFSFYCATFLIMYVNMKSKQLDWMSKIAPLIQILLLVLATWISITRISDYYHYPFDVVCGALTGVGVALYFGETEKKVDETPIGETIHPMMSDVTL